MSPPRTAGARPREAARRRFHVTREPLLAPYHRCKQRSTDTPFGRGIAGARRYTHLIDSDLDDRTDTPAPARRGRRKGRALQFLGKTLLAAGFVLAAYIVWLLWGTGIYTARQQDTLRQEITARIEDPRPDPGAPIPGVAYAILEIPSIEVDEVVVEGTDVETLKKGPGHYAKTSDPWETTGRVGIAGHRTTYGAAFWDLDKVERGDGITLRTELGTFEYRVTEVEEVLPTQVEVLQDTKDPSLILTTCSPKFSAALRLIVVAEQLTV
jgi:sortase A